MRPHHRSILGLSKIRLERNISAMHDDDDCGGGGGGTVVVVVIQS